MSGTLAEKVWADHIVKKGEGGAPDLLYIDLHLVHEVQVDVEQVGGSAFALLDDVVRPDLLGQSAAHWFPPGGAG